MSDLKLRTFNKLGQLIVHRYERYLPTAFDESLTLVQKVNKVIEYMNETGHVVDDVVEQWNDVVTWINDDGLKTGINEKLDSFVESGVLDTIINQNVFGKINERLKDIKINVKDFGAIGDGITDDSDALQLASDYAFSLGSDALLFIPLGRYKTTKTVRIKSHLDATNGTIEYYGNGTAILVGDNSSLNIVMARKTFKLPRIINMLRVTGWDGSSEGAKLVNLNTCDVYVPFIRDFEKGLVCMGYGGGHAHTTYYLGALWENHKNLVLDTFSSGANVGYTNQNLFLNGRLQHSPTKGAVLNDPNACQVHMVATNFEGGPNNNTFINTSFEGDTVAEYRVDMSGSYNQFYNCRWETPGNKPFKVRYRASATNNVIQGGYGAVFMEEVFDGKLNGNVIFDHFGSYTSANATLGQSIPNNVWTAINSWVNPVSRRITYDAITGEFTPRPGRWRIDATVTYAMNGTGRRMSRINANGSVIDVCEVPANATNRHTMKLGGVFRFDGTTKFKIETNQSSGGDLALETSPPYVRVIAEYLGV